MIAFHGVRRGTIEVLRHPANVYFKIMNCLLCTIPHPSLIEGRLNCRIQLFQKHIFLFSRSAEFPAFLSFQRQSLVQVSLLQSSQWKGLEASVSAGVSLQPGSVPAPWVCVSAGLPCAEAAGWRLPPGGAARLATGPIRRGTVSLQSLPSSIH